MAELPRRLPPTESERLRIVADRMAPGSDRGRTRWAKPTAAGTGRSANRAQPAPVTAASPIAGAEFLNLDGPLFDSTPNTSFGPWSTRFAVRNPYSGSTAIGVTILVAGVYSAILDYRVSMSTGASGMIHLNDGHWVAADPVYNASGYDQYGVLARPPLPMAANSTYSIQTTVASPGGTGLPLLHLRRPRGHRLDLTERYGDHGPHLPLPPAFLTYPASARVRLPEAP